MSPPTDDAAGPGADAARNVRERHMADTLRLLLAHRGPDARGVVWAHNAHVGDASATSLGRRGRTSLGDPFWLEGTEAVTPLETAAREGEPGTYPSGL